MFEIVENYEKHKRKKFFNRDLKTEKKLKDPHEFTVFCELLKISITDFNINCVNAELFNKAYQKYLIEFKKNPKYILPINLGFHHISTSLKYYQDRGWNEDDSKKMLKNRQSTLNSDLVSLKLNISKEEAIKKIKKITEKQNFSRKKNPKYHEIKKKYSFPTINRLYYQGKINPSTGLEYTEFEISKIITENLKKYSIKSNETKRKRNSFNSNTSLKYYLKKGLPIHEAISELTARQATNSLSKYIEKYGDDLGNKLFSERQKKRLDKLAKKSESEKIEILVKQCSGFKMYSNASFLFFKNLVHYLEYNNINNLTYFFGKNEKYIFDNKNKKIYFYDFFISELNFYIEFNGLAYHVDPNRMTAEKWNSWVHPFSKKSANEQYEYDSKKLSLIDSTGGEYYIVWEDSCIEKTYNEILSIIIKKYKTLYP